MSDNRGRMSEVREQMSEGIIYTASSFRFYGLSSVLCFLKSDRLD
jgi:hypothetical protein